MRYTVVPGNRRIPTLTVYSALVTMAYFLGGPDPVGAQATSAAERMEAWSEHEHLDRTTPFAGLEWRPVGPMQAGARVEAIAVPVGAPETIYVGIGSGNLWRSKNNGLSWTPIFEHESTFSIGDVEVAPSDPRIIWVGTGETQPRHSGYSYSGTGVFRSTDGGETWANVGLHDSHHIGKVLIHPTDPDVVWIAAMGHFWSPNRERGVFRTRDGGETWDHVLFLDETTGVVDMVMDPGDPLTIYASAWDAVSGTQREGGPGSGIYRTRDGGDSWHRAVQGLPEGPMGRIGLATSPSVPGLVFAFVDNQSPTTQEDREYVGGEVYRSFDRGDSWSRVNEDDLYPVFGVYGWKFTDIRVAPDDPDTIFILGNRAFRSTDGGKTFQRIGETIHRLHDTRGEIMHLDHHEIWIDPRNPERILLGNDGGLFQSWDMGETWLHHNNIPAAEFYSISLFGESPYTIYGGTQDNAALFGPSDVPLGSTPWDPWENVYLDRWTGGDSFDTYPDPTQPNIVYYEHQHGAMRRMDLNKDSVLTGAAESIRPRLGSGRDGGGWRSGWYTPFFLSHFDPSTVIAAGNRVLRSVNKGQDWEAISPDLSDPSDGPRGVVPFGTITMMSESKIEPGLLYAGTEGGSVWRTRQGGDTWTRLGTDLPRKWVSRLVSSVHTPGLVYLSQTGFREDDFRAYVFRSDDWGETWTSIVGNLPMESVNVIQEDPEVPGLLYVGTDLGVFVSGDEGGTWMSISSTLPTTPVHDLEVHAGADELVIGTHGRSVFVLDLTTVREFFRRDVETAGPYAAVPFRARKGGSR